MRAHQTTESRDIQLTWEFNIRCLFCRLQRQKALVK